MSIRIHKIPHNLNGNYTIYDSSDFEYADPINYFAELHINVNFEFARKYLINSFPKFPIEFINIESHRQAIIEWEKSYAEYLKTAIPKNFIDLLDCESKKQQIKLLKGQSISPEQMVAFIIKSYKNLGFMFSQYSAMHYPNGIEAKDMPLFVEIDEDTVNKVGHTTLSDNQLKHVVKFRNVTISKFLDRGLIWHCFFLTFRSVFGEESWKDGQPHLHYISDKFGITREDVLSELKSKKYNLGNLPHIKFINYRDK